MDAAGCLPKGPMAASKAISAAQAREKRTKPADFIKGEKTKTINRYEFHRSLLR
jgi:hypothetical protein